MISDIHLNSASQHTMDINPTKYNAENDLDLVSFKKLIKTASDNIKKGSISQPKFVLYLGDLVGHLRTTTESVIKDESIVFSELKNNFPTTPIFYVFGNNDSLVTNYGPFIANKRPKKETSPYEIAQSQAGWKNGFLSSGIICQAKQTYFPCMLEMEKTQGYYSAYIAPKLRLIVLNTVIFSVLRKQVTEQDASKQLLWLKSELERAKASQESVLLAMHVPPGQNVYDHSSFWLPKEEAVFLKMISRFQNRIIGILVAHTHALEAESTANEELMAFRQLQYSIAAMDQHLRQGHKRLPIILPICLYHGIESPYPHTLDLFQCFDNPDLAKKIVFKPFLLIDLTVLSDAQLLQDGLAFLMEMLLKHSRAKNFLTILNQRREPIREILRQLNRETRRFMLKYVIKKPSAKRNKLLNL